MGWGRFRKKLKKFVSPLVKAAISVAVPGGAALVSMHQQRVALKKQATADEAAVAQYEQQVAAQLAAVAATPPPTGGEQPTAPVAQAGSSVQPQGTVVSGRTKLAGDGELVTILMPGFPVMAQSVQALLETGGHVSYYSDETVEVT